MFSARVGVCLKARPPFTLGQRGSFSGILSPILPRVHHASKATVLNAIQRRKYEAPNRRYPTPGLPVQKNKSTTLPSLEDIRRQLGDAYKSPTTGFISYLPKSWIPYAELARLDKPTGTVYLFLPCAFSTLLAASMTSPVTPETEVVSTIALFLAGAFVMRGAGCTVNDLWDRNLDPYVERTKFRPIARGAVTPFQATAFLGAQLLAGLAILLQFPTSCLYYGIPSLLLVGSYPLAKRVTNYPQFVLGLTFSWGAVMGFPALGIDILSNANALYTAACLYASCVAWTINYDMVYAFMDIKDDVKAGIKSIALAHKHNTETVLRWLATTQATLLGASVYFAGGVWYFPFLLASAVYCDSEILMRNLNLTNVKSCLQYFNRSAALVGGTILMILFFVHAEGGRADSATERMPTKEGNDTSTTGKTANLRPNSLECSGLAQPNNRADPLASSTPVR